MKNFIIKNKKYFLSFGFVFIISFFGVLLSAKSAQAIGWPWNNLLAAPKDIILILVNNFLYYVVFLPISEWLLPVSGIIFDWVFGLQEFTGVYIVQEGWRISRDLVNMIFILVLLIIALATILRLDKYGIKNLLPKVIAAALLINFSLVIAGAVIDFSQVLTAFFLEPLQSEGASLSEIVAQNLSLQDTFKHLGAVVKGDVSVLISIISSIIVVLVMMFVMGAAAFLLIIRMISLWFLLVLAPIVWALWVIPGTSHLWNKWWSSFMKWTFFAPAYAFFFYLALMTISASPEGSFLGSVLPSAPDAAQDLWQSSFNQNFELIFQYIFLIFLLLAGLVTAQSMSIHGANGVISVGKKIRQKGTRWTGRTARMYAEPLTQRVGNKLDKTSSRLRTAEGNRFKQTAGKTAGWALGQAGKAPKALSRQEMATVKEIKKKYEGRTSDDLKSEYKSLVNPHSKAAVANILAERGSFKADSKKGFTEKDINKSLELAKRYKQEGALLKARPDLSSNISETLKKMKPSDMEKLQEEGITQDVKKDIIEELKDDGSFNATHLSKMHQTNPGVTNKLKDEINNKLDNLRDDIKSFVRSSPGQAIFG